MEHGPNWADDLLPRGCGQHPGVTGLVGKVREQDSDSNQDWTEL